ncbi:MAG TPA: hypothetical protein DCK87_08670 [Desulfotomaculum sp.]|nr:hypothetical protein [Desulfotomaculum sp.]
MKCDQCGFEGEIKLFKSLSFDDAVVILQCPSCKGDVCTTTTEMIEERIKLAKDLSQQLVKIVETNDVKTAKKILKELSNLNRSLFDPALEKFIKQMYKRITPPYSSSKQKSL